MIDEALIPAEGILHSETMSSEDVGKEIQLIIRGIESTINSWSAHVTSEEQAEVQGLKTLHVDEDGTERWIAGEATGEAIDINDRLEFDEPVVY